MIQINMQIAERVDEFADFEIADMRDHRGQQRVGRNVERHAWAFLGTTSFV